MTTMATVARVAGVSVATVSHVLNDTRPVRPTTRQAVLDAVDELGYTHNTLARSLVTASTRTIAVAISTVNNPYITDLLQGIEAEAVASGYTLLFGDPHDDPAHELDVVRTLHQRRVDGVIVAPSARPTELVRYLDRHRVPAVFVDRLVGEGYDQVTAESAEPVARLVDHLAEHGHRRIGMVSGLPGLSTTEERVVGYRQGLWRNRLVDEDLVATGYSEPDGAYDAVSRLLSDETITALVTGNNFMTIGAMRALRDTGRRIPEDIALVSYDDFAWADLFSPRLTAVAQPSRELGVRAVRLLLSRLADPEQQPRTVRLPTTLMHRESCGCRS